MEYYRNKRTRTMYKTFKQIEHAPKLAEVQTYKGPDKYLVNVSNVQLVINQLGKEVILEWSKEDGWHRV